MLSIGGHKWAHGRGKGGGGRDPISRSGLLSLFLLWLFRRSFFVAFLVLRLRLSEGEQGSEGHRPTYSQANKKHSLKNSNNNKNDSNNE